ncbi:MAG: hypothetical protein AB1Z23_04880 [Eubacteriales bacterium]
MLPTPCREEVKKYLSLWDSSEIYTSPDSALKKLFTQTYPNNSCMDEILIKVSCLNDFYGTNIYDTFSVAKHILSLNIDDKLQNGFISLVDDMAFVKMKDGKTKRFYSFATKYCHHHSPLAFPIYDSYVDKVLRYFKKTDMFFDFKNDDLRDYRKYTDILNRFKSYYEIENFNVKEIDIYLWQLGKEHFPSAY